MPFGDELNELKMARLVDCLPDRVGHVQGQAEHEKAGHNQQNWQKLARDRPGNGSAASLQRVLWRGVYLRGQARTELNQGCQIASASFISQTGALTGFSQARGIVTRATEGTIC